MKDKQNPLTAELRPAYIWLQGTIGGGVYSFTGMSITRGEAIVLRDSLNEALDDDDGIGIDRCKCGRRK